MSGSRTGYVDMEDMEDIHMVLMQSERLMDLNIPPPEEDLNIPPPEDLNIPPPEEELLLEDVSHHPNLQAAADGSSLFSPIDVEEIEDDLLILSPLSGFPESRRKYPITTVDEDFEVHARRNGNFIDFLGLLVSPNSHSMNQNLQANTVIMDHEIHPGFRDDYNLKRKRSMSPETKRPVENEPTFSCPVCLSDLVEACSTKCGHVFCKECIKQSIKRLKKCPTCRKPLSMKSFHRVYLPAASQ